MDFIREAKRARSASEAGQRLQLTNAQKTARKRDEGV